MKFRTTRFGDIEYPADVVLDFPEGVLGFPKEARYILLEHNQEGSPFKWLQSLDNPDLAFIVLDPYYIDERYQFEIDVDTERLIGTSQPTGCAIMCIVNVPRETPIRMSANLKAPLIVNVESRIGRQVVLSSQSYAISTPVFTSPASAEDALYEHKAAV